MKEAREGFDLSARAKATHVIPRNKQNNSQYIFIFLQPFHLYLKYYEIFFCCCCNPFRIFHIYTLRILSHSYVHLLPFTRLRTVPTIVSAHTFCASPDTRISYRQRLLIQGYFCAV